MVPADLVQLCHRNFFPCTGRLSTLPPCIYILIIAILQRKFYEWLDKLYIYTIDVLRDSSQYYLERYTDMNIKNKIYILNNLIGYFMDSLFHITFLILKIK